MKKITCLLIILLSTLFIINTIEDKLDEGLSIRELKNNIYIVTHVYPWLSNSLIVVMDNNEILLIDTPYTDKAMKEVLEWINKKFGKQKITAINTHFHIDRLGGNRALIEKGIDVYSSDLTIKAINEKGKKSLELLSGWIKDEKIKNYYKNFKYTPPNKIFKSADGLTLIFNKEKIFVKYHGPAHSMDNLVVYIPSKRIIFGGCMFIPLDNNSIGNVSDGDASQWIATLNKIETKDYDLFLLSHGDGGGFEILTHTKDVVEKYLKNKK